MSTIIHKHGFAVHTIATDTLTVEVVPELGGRISSIRQRHSGREWLSQSQTGTWWRNAPGDDFNTSTHVGIDECIPTVSACGDGKRQYPDHGEAWARPWQIMPTSNTPTQLGLEVHLPNSHLHVSRIASLVPTKNGTRLRLDYRLTNVGSESVPALWTFHPLFAWTDDMRVTIPPPLSAQTTGAKLPHDAWPSLPAMNLQRGDLGSLGTYLKLLLVPSTASAQLLAADGRLTMTWDPQLEGLGLWLTRGGYKDMHQIAIEPSSSPAETATADAAATSILPAQAQRSWWVEMCLEDS
jgi:galactose mutarotase-like enzyme